MASPVYAADPPAARVLVPLDALVALYHRPSGTTHLLASPAPELLDMLGEGPADAAALLDRLRARYDVAGGTVAAVAARLAELAAAGLVSRA